MFAIFWVFVLVVLFWLAFIFNHLGGAQEPGQGSMVGHRRPAQAAARPDREPGGDGEGVRPARAGHAGRGGAGAHRGRERPWRGEAGRGGNGGECPRGARFGGFSPWLRHIPTSRPAIDSWICSASLSTVENDLQNARRYYNAVVRDFNTRVQSFPDLLVARPLGFREREFFELDDAAEAQAPRVEMNP